MIGAGAATVFSLLTQLGMLIVTSQHLRPSIYRLHSLLKGFKSCEMLNITRMILNMSKLNADKAETVLMSSNFNCGKPFTDDCQANDSAICPAT